MLVQKRREFRFEIPLFMMLSLPVYIVYGSLYFTDTDRKRTVALLPLKHPGFRKCFVNPLRRAAFDQLDRGCDIERFCQKYQKMYMVFDAARRDQFHFVLAGNAADVWK